MFAVATSKLGAEANIYPRFIPFIAIRKTCGNLFPFMGIAERNNEQGGCDVTRRKNPRNYQVVKPVGSKAACRSDSF
jgi:hypothetical protein